MRYVNFFDAVYENSVMVVSTFVVISFWNIVKIGRLGKKFTHRLILCSFIYKSIYFISDFVEKYDGNGLKTMTMWQKNISNSACATHGFVGLQIKRDGGDLKIQSSSHLSAVKALKLKLNTLTWGIFGWFVYSVRYLVKVYKSLGIVLGTFHLQLLVTPASVMAAPRVLFIRPGFWLRAGLFLQPRGVRYLINAIFLIYIGLDFLKILFFFSPIEICISDFLFVCPDLIFMALSVSSSELLCRLN